MERSQRLFLYSLWPLPIHHRLYRFPDALSDSGWWCNGSFSYHLLRHRVPLGEYLYHHQWHLVDCSPKDIRCEVPDEDYLCHIFALLHAEVCSRHYSQAGEWIAFQADGRGAGLHVDDYWLCTDGCRLGYCLPEQWFYRRYGHHCSLYQQVSSKRIVGQCVDCCRLLYHWLMYVLPTVWHLSGTRSQGDVWLLRDGDGELHA